MTMTGLGTIIGWRAVLMVRNGIREQWCKRRLCLMLGDTGGGVAGWITTFFLIFANCQLSFAFLIPISVAGVGRTLLFNRTS